MTVLYKLTDQNWETHSRTKWGPGVTHGPTSGKGGLCGPGWLHAYTSLELALMLNPIHADFDKPVAWEAEGVVEKTDNGLKVGVRTLTTIRIVKCPKITTKHRGRFAILCAREGYAEPSFVAWAEKWLSGEDRSEAAAAKAARAAWRAAAAAAARAAWAAARTAASEAAWAAAAAARAAAEAAWAAAAAAAADAAWAAADAAWAAAWAAGRAAVAGKKIDLDALAKKAIYGGDE